ncbi:hypothetical protein PF005_g14759 [Phytophthora fragariae]|uniref:Uncharacterized protein n=2 Tax=Phytophthora TaxID=4783 RepID=A0A6A3K8Y9_9STRA|nr:hypothetical protein PF003_g35177 [Phytophthora fragariae]KAE9023392.1 hypothetical protein PR002_g11727 [Phytophthora rubi]KAE8934190.1 hypothetical protein PF009_g15826 [Phytophthora fragariae]KAE9001997.1 hypothetical protein PF011_g13496 [Phytophthora fragariae]KAE9101398.1 hypothetical protein PF010_g14466 [Phytophthora fragariae]
MRMAPSTTLSTSPTACCGLVPATAHLLTATAAVAMISALRFGIARPPCVLSSAAKSASSHALAPATSSVKEACHT